MAGQDYLNNLLEASHKQKLTQRVVIWTYFYIRNFFHYGTIDKNEVMCLIITFAVQGYSSSVVTTYIESMKNQT
jgi:hypothetical protein